MESSNRRPDRPRGGMCCVKYHSAFKHGQAVAIVERYASGRPRCRLPRATVAGALRVPGDKSISHRYALLAAIADGRSTIANYAPGADCASTLACVERPRRYRLTNPVAPATTNRRSSPSTAAACAACARPPRRSIAAIPAAPCGCWAASSPLIPSISTLVGDASLSRRPMRRIIGPLTQMGATITAGPGDRPPVDHSRRGPRRHPLHAGNAQRPGEIRRAAGRAAGQRRNLGSGAGRYS